MRIFRVGLLSSIAMVAFVAAFSTETLGQDERLIGGGSGITVFEDRNFRGEAATYQNNVSNLPSRFNNRISSVRVGNGEQWQVCDQSNYRGQCVTISGEENDLGRNNWDNRISSMRRLSGDWDGGGGGGGTSRPPSWAQGTWYWTQGYGRTLNIASNGRVTLYNQGRTSNGTYNRGNIFVDGINSSVTRSGNNIQTVNSVTGEVSIYSRNSGGGGSGGNISRPPSWAVGTWYWVEGPARRMTIESDGRITLFNQGRTSFGSYYNGTITLDGINSTITRNRNQIRTYNGVTGEVSDYRK